MAPPQKSRLQQFRERWQQVWQSRRSSNKPSNQPSNQPSSTGKPRISTKVNRLTVLWQSGRKLCIELGNTIQSSAIALQKGIQTLSDRFASQLRATGIYVGCGLKRGGRGMLHIGRSLWQMLWRHSQMAIVVVMLLLSIATFMGVLLPGTHNFEGNLIVEELSFTNLEPNKLFLNALNNLHSIEIESSQDWQISAKVQSSPEIDADAELESMTLTLSPIPGIESSYWTLTPLNDPQQNQSIISLDELRLAENTTIDQLAYDSFNSELLLTLSPASDNPDSSLGTSEMSLSFEPQPMQLNCWDCVIPELDQTLNSVNPITLILSDLIRVKMPISTATKLVLGLPDPTQANSQNWFWDGLQVADVNFHTYRGTGAEVDDELPYSTIQSGIVRLSGKELVVQPEQFLLPGEPGIETIRRIQVHHPDGLQVRIGGRSRKIEVGLDSQLPVNSIQSNLLTQYFPNDVVIAIAVFFATFIASLLAWIVEHLPKPPHRPSP